MKVTADPESLDAFNITEDDILSEDFTLEDSICSENELKYGGCECKAITFTLANLSKADRINVGDSIYLRINDVGILTQYESTVLNEYIGNGEKWGLNGIRSLTTTLAPKQTDMGLSWYKGTADAIFPIGGKHRCRPLPLLAMSGEAFVMTTPKLDTERILIGTISVLTMGMFFQQIHSEIL